MKLFNVSIVFVLIASLLAYTMPRPVAAQSIPRGTATAQQAARKQPVQTRRDIVAAGSGQPVLALAALPPAGGAAYGQPDSTEFEFPEEEGSHLARDITIFVIVSAFVAFFIIKVFIEEEEEEQSNDGPIGKPPPTTITARP